MGVFYNRPFPTTRMILTVRLNKIGDKGHPCLTPERTGISDVGPAGMRTTVDAPVYIFEIRSTTDFGTPKWERVRLITCGTLPKALRRSSQARYMFLCNLLVSRTNDWSKYVCS